jgi:hypothetical protein
VRAVRCLAGHGALSAADVLGLALPHPSVVHVKWIGLDWILYWIARLLGATRGGTGRGRGPPGRSLNPTARRLGPRPPPARRHQPRPADRLGRALPAGKSAD